MNKKILLLFAVFATFYSMATNRSVEPKVIGEYAAHFKWNKWTITDVQRQELTPLLEILKTHPDATVEIVGWADPTGTLTANDIVSTRRATNVAEYLIQNGFPAGQISSRGAGVDSSTDDYEQARRAAVTVRVMIETPETETETEPAQPDPQSVADDVSEQQPDPTTSAKENEQVPETETIEAENTASDRGIVDIVPYPRKRGIFSLRTNALYWVGAMPNLGIEWKPIHQLGIVVNGGYAPWGNNGWKKNWGGWFVAPEIRVYLGERKVWFVGPQFLAGGFNLKPKDKGYQGSVVAAGVMGGYRLRLSSCWDVDFSLGMGYGWFKYDTYRRQNDLNVYISSDLKKNTLMPIQAGVSFIWKIQ